jgi:hypothetical protein
VSRRNSRSVVGDSGFEPLTSSASRKIDAFPGLAQMCKSPAKRHILRFIVF